MSKEKRENNALALIEAELEEKKANLQGLGIKLQQAQKFIQENEPNAMALNGAIQQLEILKQKLTVPQVDKEESKEAK